MKSFLKNILVTGVLCAAFTACDEAEPVVNGASYEIESFDDFLWEKDPVDTIKFELALNFAECDGKTAPIKLALCDAQGKIISRDEATVYVGPNEVPGNIIEIIPTDDGEKIVNVGIVINRTLLTEDRSFHWHIKLLDKGDLQYASSIYDGVEESIDCENDKWIHGMDVYVKNVHVANSLKVWVNIIFWTLLIITATIIILVQVFAKRFNVTHLINIFVSENDSRRSIMNYKAGLKRTTEIILTFDRNKKQGLWAMLFKGRKSYVYIPNLPVEISLSVGSKGRVSHAICSRTANVMAEYDVPGRRMILSCKSDTFGTEYKIEYPRK